MRPLRFTVKTSTWPVGDRYAVARSRHYGYTVTARKVESGDVHWTAVASRYGKHEYIGDAFPSMADAIMACDRHAMDVHTGAKPLPARKPTRAELETALDAIAAALRDADGKVSPVGELRAMRDILTTVQR